MCWLLNGKVFFFAFNDLNIYNNVFPMRKLFSDVQNVFDSLRCVCIKMKSRELFIYTLLYLYFGFRVHLCVCWNPRYFGIWQMHFRANEITINHLFSENLFRTNFSSVWSSKLCAAISCASVNGGEKFKESSVAHWNQSWVLVLMVYRSF